MISAPKSSRPITLQLRPDGTIILNGEVVRNGDLSFSLGYGQLESGEMIGPTGPYPAATSPLRLPRWGCLTQVLVSPGTVELLTDHANAYSLFEAATIDAGYVIGNDAWEVAQEAQLQRLDPVAAFSLLSFEYVPGQETLVEGLTEIAPANHLRFVYRDGQWNRQAETVWHLQRQQAPERATTEAAFDNLLAVMEPLCSVAADGDSGPLAVNLSGGWDSRAIIAGLVRLDMDNLFACSYGNPDYSGLRIARQVSETLQINHRIVPFTSGGFLQKNFESLCRFMPPVTRFNLADGALAMGREFYQNSRGAICGHNGDGYTGVPAWVLRTPLDTPERLAAGLNRHMRGAFRHALYQEIFNASGSDLMRETTERVNRAVENNFAPGAEGFLRWKSANRVRRITAVELRMLERFTPIVYVPMLDRQFMDFWINIPDVQLAEQRLYREMLADLWFGSDARLAPLAKIPRESGGRLHPGGRASRLAYQCRTQMWRVLRRAAPGRAARLTSADPTALWWHSDPDLRLWAWQILGDSPFINEHFKMHRLRQLIEHPPVNDPSFARIGVWNMLTVAGVERLLRRHDQPRSF